MRRGEVLVLGSAVTIGLAVSLGEAFGAPAGVGGGGGALIVSIVWLWFVRRRVLAWSYQEREEDLIVQRGVLVRRLSVVPYGRMQFVDVTAGPVERSFHLATVQLHTAAAASDARIPGLEPEEATRLRDRLSALGEAKAAGL